MNAPLIAQISDADLLTAVRSGMNNVEIAKKFGCTPQWIGKILRDRGIKPARQIKMDLRRRKLPMDDVIRADVEAGLTNEQMAEKYDVSVNCVTAHLTKMGLRRKRAFIPNDDDIIACLRMGMTARQIAEKLGGNADTLTRYIRQNGLRQEIPQQQPVIERRTPRPTATIYINPRGVSLPRIPTIHGAFHAGAGTRA